MKRLLVLVVLALVWTMPWTAAAQDDGRLPIAYDESVEGEITNLAFDQEYVFQGAEGDVVVIEMERGPESSLDPYLYLATAENEILAQNDDSTDLNSMIIYRLPADGDYVIVATRLSERSGSTEGTYTLTLTKALVNGSGVTIEGTLSEENTSGTHVFVPEANGVYEITYRHVSGEYYPALSLQGSEEETSYTTELATLSGVELRGGSIIMEMSAEQLYILTVGNSYYGYYYYEDLRLDATYTVVVTLIETTEDAAAVTDTE